MDKEEFLRQNALLQKESDMFFSSVDAHSMEEKRVIHVLNNSADILKMLDAKFEEITSLSKKDVTLLFLAVALQLVRIYLLPKYLKYPDDKRVSHRDEKIKNELADKADRYVDEKKNGKKWKVIKGKYPTWEEIILGKGGVPYDKTQSAQNFSRNMRGALHRVKALGHDPILGWVFGPANILTRTITIAPEYSLGEKTYMLPFLESYNVVGAKFDSEIPTFGLGESVFSNALESLEEDEHRLPAAFVAHMNHLYSDKYTSEGLPIPFLALLNTDSAYKIYKGGYDYLDFKYDLKSASVSMLINRVISLVHLCFYDPNKDCDLKLYTVKTKKVVLYSNLIATSSDVLQTIIRSYCGDEKALKNFDIGGFCVTLYRLVRDTYLINRIKEEFVDKEWKSIIESSNNTYNL